MKPGFKLKHLPKASLKCQADHHGFETTIEYRDFI